MKTMDEQLGNFQLFIYDGYTSEEKKIIEDYWLRDSRDFIYSPKDIKLRYNISQSYLTSLNRRFVEVQYFILCKRCNSYEKHNVDNQSDFNLTFNKSENPTKIKMCLHCLNNRDREAGSFIRKEYTKFEIKTKKLESAITNENWLQLSLFEKQVLLKCIDCKYKFSSSFFRKKLGTYHFIRFIRALERLESLSLMVLSRNELADYEIFDYYILNKLRDYKNEIISYTENTFDSSSKILHSEILNPFNSSHEGFNHVNIIQFPENINIEANKPYLLGFWKKFDRMYFTLTHFDRKGESSKLFPIRKPNSLKGKEFKMLVDSLNEISSAIKD